MSEQEEKKQDGPMPGEGEVQPEPQGELEFGPDESGVLRGVEIPPFLMAGQEVLEHAVGKIKEMGPLSIQETLRKLVLPQGKEQISASNVAKFVMDEKGESKMNYECGLLWSTLGMTPFMLQETPMTKWMCYDPSRRIGPTVTLAQADQDASAKAFATFCVWLMNGMPDQMRMTVFEGPGPDAPKEIKDLIVADLTPAEEPYRAWMHALMGLSAWGSGWVNCLGFVRWAWREGVLTPRHGWDMWARMKPGMPWMLNIYETTDEDLGEGGGDEAR